MKELICIECPKGCHLKIDDELNVTGNTCPRGKVYAVNEMTCPKRIVTSTVVINSNKNYQFIEKYDIIIVKKVNKYVILYNR